MTVGIGKRLFDEMSPRWLRIGGYWYPRGGIPIDVFWQSAAPPEGLWVPEQGVKGYRGGAEGSGDSGFFRMPGGHGGNQQPGTSAQSWRRNGAG